MSLSATAKHMMFLIKRDSKPDGWTTVSGRVWPLLEGAIPPELYEKQWMGANGRARLTEKGEAVIKYSS